MNPRAKCHVMSSIYSARGPAVKNVKVYLLTSLQHEAINVAIPMTPIYKTCRNDTSPLSSVHVSDEMPARMNNESFLLTKAIVPNVL